MQETNNKKGRIKTTLIILSFILVVALGIGLAYAYFNAQSNTAAKTITTGSMQIVYEDGTDIVNTGKLFPINETEILTKANDIPFRVINNGDEEVSVSIGITEIAASSNLRVSDLKWALYEDNTSVATGNFNRVGTDLVMKQNILIPAKTNNIKSYTLRIWLQETGDDQSNLMDKDLMGRIIVNNGNLEIYEDESGANTPELAIGMIPVIYNEDKDVWEKANTRSEWYNYNEQKWANAVTVTSTNRNTYLNAEPGTPISMSDINTMFVWIPRYKYKIPSDIGKATSNPPEINVVFESGTNTTGVPEETYRAGITSSGTNTNYYTHPAFRDGSKVYNENSYDIGGWNKELTGIWVGKFETGTDNEICNTTPNKSNCKNVDPLIKPDVLSLRWQNVSTQFLTSLKLAGGTMDTSTGKVTFMGNTKYGLTASTDTHMIKSTEWGMVAILSQSQYGKMGNSEYTGTNKEVYINNSSSYYTGRSGGGPGGSSINSSSYGSYSYNDKACLSTMCTGNKTTNAGQGASTTGTIYGIYDMSGGAFEYVMGSYYGNSGYSPTSNSGFNGRLTDGTTKTDGMNFPENKYYDKFIYGKPILGNVTFETYKWYQDYTEYYGNFPFLTYGGYYLSGSNAGVFSFSADDGDVGVINTFRFSLIP